MFSLIYRNSIFASKLTEALYTVETFSEIVNLSFDKNTQRNPIHQGTESQTIMSTLWLTIKALTQHENPAFCLPNYLNEPKEKSREVQTVNIEGMKRYSFAPQYSEERNIKQ